jgi:hypothetical protein
MLQPEQNLEEGSYLRLIDFVSLNSRLERNKEEDLLGGRMALTVLLNMLELSY